MNFSSQKNFAEDPTSATGEIKKTGLTKVIEKRGEERTDRSEVKVQKLNESESSSRAGSMPGSQVQPTGLVRCLVSRLKVDFCQARQEIASVQFTVP